MSEMQGENFKKSGHAHHVNQLLVNYEIDNIKILSGLGQAIQSIL